MENKKIKTLIDKESAKSYVEFLKHSGFAHTLKISNYTTEIVSEIYNIQFLQSMRGKSTFAAYAKVKADVKNKPIPQVNKYDLRYFNHNFRADFDMDNVINIDLKSAYATALFNSQYIGEETFNYLAKIQKLDRLASVGMLASKKYVFEYNGDGKMIKYYKSVNPLENFFYYCVKEVDAVMDELRMIAEDKYLFTWVDGIYIKNDSETLVKLLSALDKMNYRYSVEFLQNFSMRIVSGKVKLSFLKEGEPKYFNIPAKQNIFARDIISLLTNQTIQNEDLHYQVKRK